MLCDASDRRVDRGRDGARRARHAGEPRAPRVPVLGSARELGTVRPTAQAKPNVEYPMRSYTYGVPSRPTDG